MRGRMTAEPGLAVAVGAAAIVGMVAFVTLGPVGAAALGGTTFWVVALMGSGHRIDRVAAWGLVVGALFIAGLQLDHEIAGILWGLGVVLLFAGILVPGLRDGWFGTAGD